MSRATREFSWAQRTLAAGLLGVLLLAGGCANCQPSWDFYQACDLIEGRAQRDCCICQPVVPCLEGCPPGMTVITTRDCNGNPVLLQVEEQPADVIILEEAPPAEATPVEPAK
jgi:hypothetical protein